MHSREKNHKGIRLFLDFRVSSGKKDDGLLVMGCSIITVFIRYHRVNRVPETNYIQTGKEDLFVIQSFADIIPRITQGLTPGFINRDIPLAIYHPGTR